MDNKERNEKILQLSCELLGLMNVQVQEAFVEDIEVEDGEETEQQVVVGVTVEDPGRLIGFKGRNLMASQFVLSLMVKEMVGEWIRVLLDVNNYREEQKERLVERTKAAIERAKESGMSVSLPAMSSFERRICHTVAAETEGVESESEGEGRYRHVVIKPKA